jgi:hypothetical protein
MSVIIDAFVKMLNRGSFQNLISEREKQRKLKGDCSLEGYSSRV